MTEPASLIVRRPHETVDALVLGDAWVVGRTDILLVGQPELPVKTLVRFEITLAGGEPVITGDGWAAAHESDDGAGTGGLRVRLRTVDKGSKAVLRRMLERQKQGLAARPAPPAPSPEPPEPVDASAASAASPDPVDAQPEATAEAEVAPLDAPGDPEGATVATPTGDATATEPVVENARENAGDVTIEDPADPELASAPRRIPPQPPSNHDSGLRRQVRSITPPGDRDALLERLRARARTIAKAHIEDVEPDQATG
jgi:hypothetical protein